jgi:hypothetical protein
MTVTTFLKRADITELLAQPEVDLEEVAKRLVRV